jgi:hypothetical protein
MKFSCTAVCCCLATMVVFAMPTFSAEESGGKKLRGLSSSNNGNGDSNSGNNGDHGKPTVNITDEHPGNKPEVGGGHPNNDMFNNTVFDQRVIIKFSPGKKEDVKMHYLIWVVQSSITNLISLMQWQLVHQEIVLMHL